MRRWVPCLALLAGCVHPSSREVSFIGAAEQFAPASSEYSDVRLTISPDGKTAMWFSRNRPGGAGGYDIWLSRRVANRWSAAETAPFNSPGRDFDPAFTADGRFVYFCSDRPGGAGGDDLWRVRVTGSGFGAPEHLGATVNSDGNEWAPMMSPDGATLLFASDGLGGAGRMDLFTARRVGGHFEAARALPGDINTGQDEFDATYLADGRTVVFSRARDIRTDDVRLFQARQAQGRYHYGHELPGLVNTAGSDTYAPMLDWSDRGRISFTTRRPASSERGVDVYVVRYRP
jgi:TolB protein